MKRIYLLVVLACAFAFANAADSNWALWVWASSGGLQNINGGTNTDHDLKFQTTSDPNVFEIVVNGGLGQDITAGGEFCFRDIGASKWYKSNSTSVSTVFNKDAWTLGGYWTGGTDKNMSVGSSFKCKRILLYFIDIQHYSIIFESEPTTDPHVFNLYTWIGGAFNSLSSKVFSSVKKGLYCLEIPNGETFLDGSNGFLVSQNGGILLKSAAAANALNAWIGLKNGNVNNILLPSGQKIYKIYMQYVSTSSTPSIYASTIPLTLSPLNVSATQYLNSGKLTFNAKITAGAPVELAGFTSFIKNYTVKRDNVVLAASVAPDANGNLSYIDATAIFGVTYNYSVVCNYIDYTGSTDVLKSAEVAALPLAITLPTATNIIATPRILYDDTKGNNIFVGAEINWTNILLDELIPYNITYKVVVNDKSSNLIHTGDNINAAPYIVYGLPESEIKVEAVYTPKLLGDVFTPVAELAIPFVPSVIVAPVVNLEASVLQVSTDPGSGTFRAVMQWAPDGVYPVAYYKGYRADITTNLTPEESDYVQVEANGNVEFTVPTFDDLIKGASTLNDHAQVKFAYKIFPYYNIWNKPISGSLITDADFSDYSKSQPLSLAFDAVLPTEILFDRDTPTSVEGIISSSDNIAYPNPTEGELNVKFAEPIRKVELINLSSGTLCSSFVFDGTEVSVTVNVSDLSSGLYAIKVNDTYIGKVMKK